MSEHRAEYVKKAHKWKFIQFQFPGLSVKVVLVR